MKDWALPNNTCIKNMQVGQKNITTVFIVLEVGPPIFTKESREVRTFKVADQTACINASIWDEAGQLLVPGDIVRLNKGYIAVWKNCLTLYASKYSELQKVGDFQMLFNEQINMSEPRPSNLSEPQSSMGTGLPQSSGAQSTTAGAGMSAHSSNNSSSGPSSHLSKGSGNLSSR